jgi:hypothetical protein
VLVGLGIEIKQILKRDVANIEKIKTPNFEVSTPPPLQVRLIPSENYAGAKYWEILMPSEAKIWKRDREKEGRCERKLKKDER